MFLQVCRCFVCCICYDSEELVKQMFLKVKERDMKMIIVVMVVVIVGVVVSYFVFLLQQMLGVDLMKIVVIGNFLSYFVVNIVEGKVCVVNCGKYVFVCIFVLKSELGCDEVWLGFDQVCNWMENVDGSVVLIDKFGKQFLMIVFGDGIGYVVVELFLVVLMLMVVQQGLFFFL